MKSLTVWHGHSTQPSLPAGTARKDSGHLSGWRPLHLANARPFGRSKAPLGLSLLRCAAQRELAYGRQSRLIMPPAKKNRVFPTGNALLYISLSSVVFGRVRPIQGRTLFFFALNLLTHGSRPHSSNIPPGHHRKQIIRTRLLSETSSDYFCLVRVARIELTAS